MLGFHFADRHGRLFYEIEAGAAEMCMEYKKVILIALSQDTSV